MRKLLLFLLLLSSFPAFSSDQDSLKKIIATGTDSQRYKAVKTLLSEYISYQQAVGDTSSADSARKYFPVMERLATDTVRRIEYDLFQGWFLVKYNLLQSFEHIRNAIKGSRESKNNPMIAQCYLTAGMLSENELDFSPALVYYFAASNYFRLTKDELHLAACNVKIGNILAAYFQYDRALEYLNYAANVFQKFKDYRQYGQATAGIIAAYLRKGDLPKGMEVLKTMSDELKGKGFGEPLVKANVEVARYYMNMGNFPETEKYLAKAHTLATTFNTFNAYRIMPYLAYANMNLAMGNGPKALQYLQYCDELFQKVKIRDRDVNSLYSELKIAYSTYYTSIGDQQKAMASYAEANSSITNDLMTKISALVRVSEAEKEENYTIANLQLNIEEARKIVERTNTKLNYLIIFAGLLIFVLAAIFYRYRERQKIAKYLETEVDARTQELKAQSEEKTLMLKEIHHRVKNNLQLISSFLNLQKHYSSADKSTEDIISETQERVRCMAIIHEKLYSAESLANLDTKAYLSEIAMYVYQSYVSLNSHIKIHLNIESAKLTLDRMIPCGLIINELLSNCFKYAFKGRTEGDIWVDFIFDEETQLKKLQIRDNGIGLPADFSVEKLNSLGMNIVLGLVDQLDGKVEMKGDGGTMFEIEFI